jgi:hypothetical protein
VSIRVYARSVYNRSVPDITWFVPGRLVAPHGPLTRYRPVQSAGAVGTYVETLTQPGELVVDLFCQGPTVVREAVSAGRRALGFSINPILLTIVQLGLCVRDADAVNAAFTHLADSLKGDVPLRHHMVGLYRSACPTCGAQGIAEWFAWDRDGQYPFEKAVRCPDCEDVQEGGIDDDDIEFARRFQSRGLTYYHALNRVAPLDHPARDRAAELVQLYTPRNLSALMDLAMRIEELETDEKTLLALTGVLLDCFDAGSSLDPYDEERLRPRTLRVPSRFIERNVWLLFEDSLSRLLAEEVSFSGQPVSDVEALVRGEASGYGLVRRAARDVGKTIPEGGAALLFVDPPRPDAVFWALSALWAGWLWDSPAAQGLRPFLRRRRFDWDWHCRMLHDALAAVGPLLAPEGHLIVPFSSPEETLLESVFVAASAAGFKLAAWGYSPEVGYRLVWRWKGSVAPPVAADDAPTLERELMAVVQEAVLTTLRERGEPTGWPLLRGSAYAALAEHGLLARVAAIHREDGREEDRDFGRAFAFTTDAVRRALEGISLTQLLGEDEQEGGLWWLTVPSSGSEPLADRVGHQVWELLAQRPVWDSEELVNAVYARFPGPLTPNLALVLACIDSYSMPENGTLRLRSEDDPKRRSAERKMQRDNLAALGKRLGFGVRRHGGWDVRWRSEGRDVYVFRISVALDVGRHLLTRRAADEGAQRCLVLPGGRAGLVSFKLQRDPRLTQIVESEGWQFVKFRHLRRLLAERDLDRHALKTVLGLDPIVEQETAQIPLF